MFNTPFHPEDAEDFHGNIHEEGHKEMIQEFGREKPNQQWILTDYDVWARNPYYVGPDQPHPEDDSAYEAAQFKKLSEDADRYYSNANERYYGNSD